MRRNFYEVWEACSDTIKNNINSTHTNEESEKEGKNKENDQTTYSFINKFFSVL